MHLRFCKVIVTAFVFLSAFSFAQAAPTEQEIARAVRQLGDNEFGVREQASKFLWEAGKPAEPALKEALKSVDQEIVQRARAILDKFKWGIYPDMPEKVVKLIREYQSAEDEGKLAAVSKLLEAGSPGYAALVKIAGAVDDAETRKGLWEQITKETPRIAGILIMEGSFDRLEEMLETCLASDTELSKRNYAAFLLLRSRIDGKITQLNQRLEKSKDKQTAEMLAYLYRAKGDLPNALRAAERTDKRDLKEDLLLAVGDYKGIVLLPPEPANYMEDAAPGRVSCRRASAWRATRTSSRKPLTRCARTPSIPGPVPCPCC